MPPTRRAAPPIRPEVLEQFDDAHGRHCYRFVLPGAPRTKKNSSRVLRMGTRNKIVPSAQWLAWRDACHTFVVRHQQLWLRITRPVNCAALFYRDANRGDSHGYYNGLADVLQEAQIVVDDVMITQWDGSRLLRDTSNPRTVVTLTVLGESDRGEA